MTYPEMEVDLMKIVVNANTRRIGARWGFEVTKTHAMDHDRRKDSMKATIFRRLFG